MVVIVKMLNLITCVINTMILCIALVQGEFSHGWDCISCKSNSGAPTSKCKPKPKTYRQKRSGPPTRAIQLFHWRAHADEHIQLCKLGTLVARKRVPSLNSVTSQLL